MWYIAFPGWGISQGYVGEVLNRAGENGLFKSAPGFEVNFDVNSEAAETLKDWKRLYDKKHTPRGILSLTSDSDIDGMYATGKFLYGKWWLYMLRGWNDANFSKTIFPDGRPGTSVVPPKDHVALARSLVRLSRNSEKRQQLANAGRLRAQDFAWSTIADRVIAYYEELVNESEIGGPYWTQSADLVGTGHPE